MLVERNHSTPPFRSWLPAAARRQEVREAARELAVVAILGIGRVEDTARCSAVGRDAVQADACGTASRGCRCWSPPVLRNPSVFCETCDRREHPRRQHAVVVGDEQRRSAAARVTSVRGSIELARPGRSVCSVLLSV